MYDMYPEWGPAAHDAEHPHHPQRSHARRWEPHSAAVAAARPTTPDLRDARSERPDDN